MPSPKAAHGHCAYGLSQGHPRSIPWGNPACIPPCPVSGDHLGRSWADMGCSWDAPGLIWDAPGLIWDISWDRDRLQGQTWDRLY